MKIADTRQDSAQSTQPVSHPTGCELSTLNDVASAELHITTKACELDPLQTLLHQEFVDDLHELQFVTVLCNRSIKGGVLPPSLKRKVLVPALNSCGLN